nr:YdcF family protein [Anaerolineaceae bacterium]
EIDTENQIDQMFTQKEFPDGIFAVNETYAALAMKIAQKRGFQSLIIVTDPFHTFRTRLIFRSVFRDSGIDLYVRPVRNHWYRSTTWWATSQGRQATLSEYIKIIAYFSGLESGLIE